MLRANNGFDIAADVEIPDYFDFPRVKQPDQVIQDDVDDVFMKDAAIAILVDVELQALQFDAPVFRDVLDVQCREVRKTGSRADAREFGTAELDFIPPDFGTVRKSLQARFADQFRSVRTQGG